MSVKRSLVTLVLVLRFFARKVIGCRLVLIRWDTLQRATVHFTRRRAYGLLVYQLQNCTNVKDTRFGKFNISAAPYITESSAARQA